MEVNEEELKSDPMTILKCEILNFIANCEGAHFKSQQRGEPDLTLNEKRCIASDILDTSPGRFLSRFWSFLLPSHLPFFASLTGDDYEVKFYIEKLEKKFNCPPSKALVKNRRLEAMRRLAHGSEYFTDEEMKKRNPLLYEQLVRKYMSSEERMADSAPDTDNKTFSSIILDQMERDEVDKLMKTQKVEEENDEDEASDMDLEERLDDSSDSDASLDRYGGTWGEIEPQLKKKSSFKRERKRRKAAALEEEISDDEKELLLAEFRSTMHAQFLLGKEKDFDYSEVDANEDYDNLEMIELDEQDTYFDSESPSGHIDCEPITEGISRLGR